MPQLTVPSRSDARSTTTGLRRAQALQEARLNLPLAFQKKWAGRVEGLGLALANFGSGSLCRLGTSWRRVRARPACARLQVGPRGEGDKGPPCWEVSSVSPPGFLEGFRSSSVVLAEGLVRREREGAGVTGRDRGPRLSPEHTVGVEPLDLA